MKKIPLAGPWITQKEIDYATDAATNAWYDNHNLYNAPFEKKFAEFIGVKYAICVPHCTSAIHLSALAFDLKPGDEVIVPDVTWIASVAPIVQVGAKLVFADIDPKTWCIDPHSIEKLITPKTKAIVTVGLYGSMPDFDRILPLAKKHGLKILEDAAEALGSTYNGKQAGSFGDTGVFSFHASKTISTGEGGMVVTNDQKLYDRMQVLRDHGREPGNIFYQNNEVAYKYKMSPVQAALGLAQLERVEDLVARKREIFAKYKNHLHNHPDITLNFEPSNVENSYWLTTVVINPDLNINKFELLKKMAEKHADCRPFFSPLTNLPAFADFPDQPRAQAANKTGYIIGENGINLPSAPTITDEQIQTVCDALATSLSELK